MKTQQRFWILTFLLTQAVCLPALASEANIAGGKSPRLQATLVATYTLPRMSLSRLGPPGYSEAALAKARHNGLKYDDLPSIGSGLAKVGEDEYVGITDRGPNTKVTGADGHSRRLAPLPGFCPTIVRFRLADGRIQIVRCLPLHDRHGKWFSGLSNTPGDERLYVSATAKAPLPFDQDGVDPEGIRLLPNGDYLLSEEYSPSVLVVSPDGQVLVRYTPATKPLTQATYPVKPILPSVFTHRRINKGFENLALSGDGRFAYVILQTPMGDAHDPRYANSRVLRMLKLDVTHPLHAKVVGEYLALTSPASAYGPKQKQRKISWSDALWIAPEKLLVVERGKGLVNVRLADISQATNVLNCHDAAGLAFEAQSTDLRALGVRTAKMTDVFSTRSLPGIHSDKIEGLAPAGPNELALSNDNDFGLRDNRSGQPSRVWIVRVPGLAVLK